MRYVTTAERIGIEKGIKIGREKALFEKSIRMGEILMAQRTLKQPVYSQTELETKSLEELERILAETEACLPSSTEDRDGTEISPLNDTFYRETRLMSESVLKYEEKMWELFDLTKEQMPDLTESYYGAVKDAVYRDGALDVKMKRLMSLAVAVQAGCKDCMISQTSKALELGATPAEIFEACAVAVSMGGTLAWSKALVVADYLQERGLIKTRS